MATLSTKVRVFLLEDHLIFRHGLAEVLGHEPDLEVVGEASGVEEALAKLGPCKPDVVLLESRLNRQRGLGLLPRLAQVSPEARVVVFTNPEGEADVVEAMRLGARGFLSKKSPTALILTAIRKVAAGEIWLESRHLERVVNALREGARRSDPQSLSPREKDIIRLVMAGCRNKEVAAELHISEKTVKNHLSNIFDKVGVGDRLELALYVIDKKLLD